MSVQSLQQRKADVRANWSYRERQRRAMAGEQRCRQLLERLGLLRMRQAPAWAAKSGF